MIISAKVTIENTSPEQVLNVKCLINNNLFLILTACFLGQLIYRLGCKIFHLSGFSQTCKIGIIDNFVFPYLCSFLFLQHIMLENVILVISESNKITFEGRICHSSSSFLMAHMK